MIILLGGDSVRSFFRLDLSKESTAESPVGSSSAHPQ